MTMNTPEFIAKSMDCRKISKDIAMNIGALFACRQLGRIMSIENLEQYNEYVKFRDGIVERQKVMRQALKIHKCEDCYVDTEKLIKEREFEIVYPSDL